MFGPLESFDGKRLVVTCNCHLVYKYHEFAKKSEHLIAKRNGGFEKTCSKMEYLLNCAIAYLYMLYDRGGERAARGPHAVRLSFECGPRQNYNKLVE